MSLIQLENLLQEWKEEAARIDIAIKISYENTMNIALAATRLRLLVCIEDLQSILNADDRDRPEHGTPSE